MRIRDLKAYFNNALACHYDEHERRSLFNLLAEELLGHSAVELQMNIEADLDPVHEETFRDAVRQLRKYIPVQYILGKAYFYGLALKVNSHVLIPRPETEELVAWIISDIRSGLQASRILDIGTGSGCIAIALKKTFPHLSVHASDFRVEVLEVARTNAALNGVEIGFHHFDILHTENTAMEGHFDLIVSNPPYLVELDKHQMKPNVLDHEPPKALFVQEDHPLLFYDRILGFARHHLSPAGSVYFEINERMGQAMQDLCNSYDPGSVVIHRDIHGKDRMARILFT